MQSATTAGWKSQSSMAICVGGKLIEHQLEFDRSLIGRVFPVGSFTVTRELITKIAKAVGETDPIYTDVDSAQDSGHHDLLAPPTICNLLVRGIKRPNVKLQGFSKMRVHGGQALYSIKPIHAGDKLDAKTHLEEIYTKTGRTGTMAFIIWQTEFFNQEGELVTQVKESFACWD
jgi:acyl dehydratase